ncbi:pirin family protein [Hymenobacter profundi]|uniref:Pirin family protein n=1 Tax=Hymenobacter profundi TaxID=1982110 RepID=A0ABS6WXY2_9BACT|nr:pirin family protein [Hymenobacter profundi]MBW3128087.1 pirin family protein [Hymenobacter profundi]
MPHRLTRAHDRGLKDLGWLQSNFSLSFGPYANPERAGFGLLRAFNDDFVQPGKGFGLHAHANMEIISIMLAGRMNHIDSLGYKEEVGADWVQIMSAGSGLRHEEHNVGDDTVNFLQIWIEPKLQNVTPRYQRRHFPAEKRHNQLTTVVSNEEGTAHCWINQNAKLSLGFYDAGQQLTYSLNPLNKCVFIFVMEGALTVNGQAVAQRESLGLWETSEVQISCEAESKFIVIETPINH